MYWNGDHMGNAGWVAMSIGMIAFWALVITAVVLIYRSTAGSKLATNHGERLTPAQILNERFARGEIDESEYASRLATLNRRPSQSPPEK